MKIKTMTPRTEKALSNASYIAEMSGHSYVGTEHVFMALLDPETSPSIKGMLEHIGVDTTDLRHKFTAYWTEMNTPTPVADRAPWKDMVLNLRLAADELERQNTKPCTKTP